MFYGLLHCCLLKTQKLLPDDFICTFDCTFPNLIVSFIELRLLLTGYVTRVRNEDLPDDEAELEDYPESPRKKPSTRIHYSTNSRKWRKEDIMVCMSLDI